MSRFDDQRLLREQKSDSSEAPQVLKRTAKPPSRFELQNTKKAGGKPQAATAKSSDVYARLEVDLERLKGLSVPQKSEIKVKLVSDYRPEALAYFAGDDQFEKLASYWVLWLFDAGELEDFLVYIAQAQEKDLLIYKFGDPLLSEAKLIERWAKEQLKAKEPASPYFDQSFDRLDKAQAWPLIGPEPTADLWYLRYYLTLESGDKTKAIEQGKLALGHGAGIKTNLVKLIKEVEGAEAAKAYKESLN